MARDSFPDGVVEQEFQIRERLLLINVHVSHYRRDHPYDAVRYAWKVNSHRAERYTLALAHDKVEVVGAYRPTEWLPATHEKFRELAGRYNLTVHPGRYGFVGEPAEPDVWSYYVGKRVPERFRRSQSPVRYLKPGM
ncbi:MAG: hypothetical protein OXO53_06640 [Chloroflexota bacterium]|nr:hypothetical protein [Chloroflexota bacterium]